MITTKPIATIELDGSVGTGKIFAQYEESSYYESDDINKAWIIRVELPNGKLEDPAIAPQKTIDDVIEAIGASWGGAAWKLEWVD